MAKAKKTSGEHREVEWFSTPAQANDLARARGVTSVDVRCTVPEPDVVATAREMVRTLLRSKLERVRVQLPTNETELGWALDGAVVPEIELVDRRMMNHEVSYAFVRDGDRWPLDVKVPVVARKVMGVASTALEGVFRELEPMLATIPRSALSKVTFTPKPKTAPPAARKRLDAIAKRFSAG